MFKQTSNKFKVLFLLQFTRELIKHSKGDIVELEIVLNKENRQKKEEFKQIIKEKEKPLIERQKKILPRFITKPIKRIPLPILRIPEPKLPLRLQYLKPIPSNKQIFLEKLDSLVKDPMVQIIQCNGPDKNIIVRGGIGTRKTNIILDKDDINQIIEKFSETSKIPIQQGVFTIVVGRLVLSAIVSDLVSSKFIIKKIMYNPNPIFRK